jgi:hypothetical protein
MPTALEGDAGDINIGGPGLSWPEDVYAIKVKPYAVG